MDNIHFRFLSSNRYWVFGYHGYSRMPLNIYETSHAIVIMAEICSADPDTLQVEVHTDMVRIRGERQFVIPPNIVRIHRMEIDAGPFEMTIPLSTQVDPARATSRYRDGLIEIVLPILRMPAQRIAVSIREEA